MPNISIGVTTYMFEPYLQECLESLIRQRARPWKIVVCDDCSSDDSWEIISAFKNSYPELFDIYRPAKNLGPNEIGTFLIERMPKADYLATIDGDDRWHTEKLEREIKALQNSNADVAYSDVNIIDKDGILIRQWLKRSDVPDNGDLFTNVYGKRIFENCESVFRNELLTRKAFEAEGAFDSSLSNYWDWDRKIKFARSFRIAFSGDALVDYRKHPEGICKTFGKKNLFAAHIQVYEKHLSKLLNLTKLQQIKVRLSFESRMCLKYIEHNIENLSMYSPIETCKRILEFFIKLNKNDQKIINCEYSEEISRLFNSIGSEPTGNLVDIGSFISQMN